jgi:2-oxoglutarate ferredoxin oxidoreductase subunit gamma
MSDVKQIRLCGTGGQGIVIAGTILGFAAIYDGQWVTGSDSYGAQARGGSAVSELVVSGEPIVFPHVIESDILISLSQDTYDKYIENMCKKEGIVIYDDLMVTPQEQPKLKQIAVSATDTAIGKLDNRQVANAMILGAAAAFTGIVSKEALNASIEKNVQGRLRALNLKALDAGFVIGGDLRKEVHSSWS